MTDDGKNEEDGVEQCGESQITREEKKPYFLLWGRSGKVCKKPKGAIDSDQIYNWTWDNLKTLVGGGR